MHICVAVSQGSKTYLLRSTLDTALIERASATNKRILEVEAADAPDDVDDAEPGARTYGSLIAWNGADQLATLGILYVILALILVSGKVITDSTSRPFPSPLLYPPFTRYSTKADLRMLLRRLRLRPPTQIALPAHTPHRTLTFDAYLSQLQRQGYLDRTRDGATGAAQKRRRGGGGAGATQQPGGGGGGEENDVRWEWRWGPRAAAEIGEAAVARFVAEFMAERASGGGGAGRNAADGAGGEEGSDEEVGGRRARAHREEAQKRLKALLKGVELAAGGDLAGPTV
jgi:hypothetical protein